MYDDDDDDDSFLLDDWPTNSWKLYFQKEILSRSLTIVLSQRAEMASNPRLLKLQWFMFILVHVWNKGKSKIIFNKSYVRHSKLEPINYFVSSIVMQVYSSWLIMDDLIIHDKKTIGLNKDNDWRFRVLYSVKRITMTFRYKNKN